MNFEFRKLTIEFCRADIDCIKAVLCFAFDHRKAMAARIDAERFEIQLDVADGIYHMLKDRYNDCISDEHAQVEPFEYAAAEGSFGTHQRQEIFKDARGETICVTLVGGDPQHDCHSHYSPKRLASVGWHEIPDLIGRAAVDGMTRGGQQ
jgi:hypothetical protein